MSVIIRAAAKALPKNHVINDDLAKKLIQAMNGFAHTLALALDISLRKAKRVQA
jgi:hypothetical protein